MKDDPSFDKAMRKMSENDYQFALLMRGLPNTYQFDRAHWPAAWRFDSGEVVE
jgi:hypothetical protein